MEKRIDFSSVKEKWIQIFIWASPMAWCPYCLEEEGIFAGPSSLMNEDPQPLYYCAACGEKFEGLPQAKPRGNS